MPTVLSSNGKRSEEIVWEDKRERIQWGKEEMKNSKAG